MIRTAQGVMDAYSGLEASEKRKFDIQYKDLNQFTQWLNQEVDKILNAKKSKPRPKTKTKGQS
jgi:hypothetical protein